MFKDKVIYQRIQAQLKFFSRDRGFGFLKRPNKPDIFVTAKALLDSNINPTKLTENDVLEFDLIPIEGKGGRARNLKLITKAKDASTS